MVVSRQIRQGQSIVSSSFGLIFNSFDELEFLMNGDNLFHKKHALERPALIIHISVELVLGNFKMGSFVILIVTFFNIK